MRRNTWILLTLILFLLNGCQAMFQTNIFEAWDKKDYDDFEKMSVDELLAASLQDDTFVDQLTDESDTVVNQVIANLQDEIDNSGNNDTVMEAASLQSEIILVNSGSDDTLQNVNTLLTSMLTDSSANVDLTDPATLMGDLFGNASTAEVETQITAMLAAAAALDSYGTALDAEGGAPPTVDSDELGSTALMVGMATILSNGGANTPAQIASNITTGSPALTLPADTNIFNDTNADGTLESSEVAGNLDTIMTPGLSAVIMDSTIGDSLSGLSGMMGS